MARERIFAAATVGLLMALYLAPHRAKAGASDSEDSISASLPTATLFHARQLLRAGQTGQAERLLRADLTSATDDSLLCLSGEIHFRRASFLEATSAFTAALTLNPQNARAHWGLGRIDQLHFRANSARDRFARAFSLNHRDTDIILSYAEYVSDPAAHATLLRNVVTLARQEQPERAERAMAQLRILERLQGRPPARLASPYTAYRLPLSGFRPVNAGQDGVLVQVRINGGKALRLLLDTGARGLSIDSRSARGLNLDTIVASSLAGFGDTGAGASRVAIARRVNFGSLAFDECLVEVSDHRLTAGADGILGVDIFERFQIDLDPAARLLELTPLEASAAAPSADSIPAIGLRNLLLVKARLVGGKVGGKVGGTVGGTVGRDDGLFLVDTGAAFSSVAKDLVPANRQQGRAVDLQGAQGSLFGAMRVGPLAFQVGRRAMVDIAPVAMDLRQVSQMEGVEISGILGYSVLGRASLKINLRNGIVEFAKSR